MPTEASAKPSAPVPRKPAVHVLITREPFSDFFVITLDNGQSEELEVEDCKKWFKDRGANMDAVDKAMDHCWNFYRSEVNINNFKELSIPKLPHAPEL